MKPANVIVVAALMVLGSDVAAQEGGTLSDARFEVASVKPAENRSMRFNANPGQLTGRMALIEFLNEAQAANTVVLRVIDSDGDSETTTFRLAGLKAALPQLACYRKLTAPK